MKTKGINTSIFITERRVNAIELDNVWKIQSVRQSACACFIYQRHVYPPSLCRNHAQCYCYHDVFPSAPATHQTQPPIAHGYFPCQVSTSDISCAPVFPPNPPLKKLRARPLCASVLLQGLARIDSHSRHDCSRGYTSRAGSSHTNGPRRQI